MARVARLGVVIDSSGAKRGAQETNTALKSIDQTAQRTVKELQKAAATLGVAFGIRGLQQAVDQYTMLDARLRQVTKSGAEFSRVQGQLFNIAQQSRASYAATIDLYTRLARSSDQLGISQGQLVSVTEAVSNAVRLSNASTGAAEAGLVQLGQAFASGTLRGDELRSIMEQLPAVAKAIADGLGVPIGRLREMGEAGELSGRKVAMALDSQRETLALLAGEIPTTIGQALQQLNNAFGLVVAGSDDAKSATAGIAGALGEAARFMVEYKDAVMAVTVALGVGGLTLAAVKAGAALSATAGAAAIANFASLIPVVGSLTEALALARYGATLLWTAVTGPVGIAIAGLTAVAAAVYFWRKRQKEAEEAVRQTTQSTQELYDEAKKLASVNFVPPTMIAAIQNLGGELQAARSGGQQAVAAFRAAADQWKDTGDKARTFAQALAEGDTKAQTLLSTSRAQVQLSAQVESTLARQTKAQHDAAKAAKDLQEALDKTAFSSGLARERALENANALRQFVQPVKLTFAEVINLIQAQERAANVAEAHAAAVRLGIADTIAYKAEVMTAAQVEDLRAQGISLTTEQLERLAEANRRVVAAQQGEGGTSPVAATEDWANSIRDLIGVVQLLGQAFGDVGRTVSGIGTGAQSIVSGLQRAGSIKNASGQAVGLGGALSGAAGASGVLAGLGAAGAIAAGVVQLADAVDLFGSRAKQRAKEIAEATARFNEGIAAFQGRALGTDSSVGAAIAQAERDLKALLAEVDKAFRGAARNREGLRVQGLFDADVQRIASDFFGTIEDAFDSLNGNQIAIDIRRAGAALEEQANSIVALRKAGAISEEEAALALIRVRELYDATVKKLEETAAAAAKAAEAQRAFDRGQFGLDLTQRRQTLNGDSRGAFITGQTIQTNSALAEAQKLVEAGVITQAMFEELRVLLGDEMVQALADFDKAAREVAEALAEQKRQTMEDLTVRALVAQGRTAEAAQAQIEIANRRELVGVTDEVVRAEILRVQGLEATRRELDALAEAERVRAEQNASIDQRMIEALRTLDPARAQQIEQTRKEIERSQELAAAADESTAARLRELYAMQDAAAAAIELADALATQKQRAEALASFTQSIGVQYLRSQGRGFDADVAELREWRAAQEKSARELGAGSEVFAQIAAIFDSRYNALIAATVAQGAEQSAAAVRPEPISFGSASPEQVTIIGEDTTAVRSARSISESSALQLVDYAASQLAVQRRILAVLEGGAAEVPSLAGASALQTDQALGLKASQTALLVHGVVL